MVKIEKSEKAVDKMNRLRYKEITKMNARTLLHKIRDFGGTIWKENVRLLKRFYIM